MKANKVINDYSKYKKVPTTIKGDLLLDDNFLSNHQSTKDQQHINIVKDTVSAYILFYIQFYTWLCRSWAFIIIRRVDTTYNHNAMLMGEIRRMFRRVRWSQCALPAVFAYHIFIYANGMQQILLFCSLFHWTKEERKKQFDAMCRSCQMYSRIHTWMFDAGKSIEMAWCGASIRDGCISTQTLKSTNTRTSIEPLKYVQY